LREGGREGGRGMGLFFDHNKDSPVLKDDREDERKRERERDVGGREEGDEGKTSTAF